MIKMKIQHITTKFARALLFLGLLNVGCVPVDNNPTYPSIDVQVVDAETGEPIEGAVLLAQWTITTFLYESASSNYKVVEKVSDESGRMTVPGVFKFGVNEPKVVVYKKGYVAWRHDYIFPDYKKRTDFMWRDRYMFKLERFKQEYSRIDHLSFIESSYSSGVSSDGLFIRALSGKLEY